MPMVYAWLYIPGIHGNFSDVYYFFFSHDLSGFEGVKVSLFLGIMLLIFFILVIQFTLATDLPKPSRLFLWI